MYDLRDEADVPIGRGILLDWDTSKNLALFWFGLCGCVGGRMYDLRDEADVPIGRGILLDCDTSKNFASFRFGLCGCVGGRMYDLRDKADVPIGRGILLDCDTSKILGSERKRDDICALSLCCSTACIVDIGFGLFWFCVVI